MLRRTILGLELEIPPPHVEITEHGEGLEHVDSTLGKMGALALQDAADWRIRHLAVAALREAGAAWKDKRAEVAALYDFVATHVDYRADPIHLEWVQRPLYTLVSGAGDCDDIATLLAALFASVGIPFRYRTVGETPEGQDHVQVEAAIGDGPGDWISVDPVLIPEGGLLGARVPGSARLYTPEGSYVGMGGPPDERARRMWHAGDSGAQTVPRAQGGMPDLDLWTRGEIPALRSADPPALPAPEPEGGAPDPSLWQRSEIPAFQPQPLPPGPPPAPEPAEPPAPLTAVTTGGELGATPSSASPETLPELHYNANLDLSGAPAPLAFEWVSHDAPVTPTGTGKNPIIVRSFDGVGRVIGTEADGPTARDVYRTFQAPVWNESQANLRRLLVAKPPAEIIADPMLEPERWEAAIGYRVNWCVEVARNVGRMRLALNWLTHDALDEEPIERFRARWRAQAEAETHDGFAASYIVPWDAGALPRGDGLFQWRTIAGIGPGLLSGVPRDAGFEGNSPPDHYSNNGHVPAPWRAFFRMFWGSDLAKPSEGDQVLSGGAVTLSYLEELASRYAITPFTDAIALCWSRWLEINFGETYAERLRAVVEEMQPGAGHEPIYFPPRTWASIQEAPERVDKTDAQRSALESRRASAISAIQAVFAELRRSPAPGELEATLDELSDESGTATVSLEDKIAKAREWLRTLRDAADVSADAIGAIEAGINDAEASVRAGYVEDAFALVAGVLGQLDSLAGTVQTIGDVAAQRVSSEIKGLVEEGIGELTDEIVQQVASQIVQTAVTAIGTTVASVLGAAVGAAIGKIVAAIVTDPGSFFSGGITIKREEYLDVYGLAITSPLLRWVAAPDMRADLVRLKTGRSLDEFLRMLCHTTQVTGADLGLSPNVSPILSQTPPPVTIAGGLTLEAGGMVAAPLEERSTMTRHDPHPEIAETYPPEAEQLYDFGADLYRVYLPDAAYFERRAASGSAPAPSSGDGGGGIVHQMDTSQLVQAAGVNLLGARRNPITLSMPLGQTMGGNGMEAAANDVAREVRSRGYNYDRAMVRDFQRRAGLSTDGLYGPATRDAVAYFGTVRPPEPLFAGGSETFTPPPEGGDTGGPKAPGEPGHVEPSPTPGGAPQVEGYHHIGDESKNPGLPPVGITDEPGSIPAGEAAPGGVKPPPSPGGEPSPPSNGERPATPPSGAPAEPPPGGVPSGEPGARPCRTGVRACPWWVWALLLYQYSQSRR